MVLEPSSNIGPGRAKVANGNQLFLRAEGRGEKQGVTGVPGLLLLLLLGKALEGLPHDVTDEAVKMFL